MTFKAPWYRDKFAKKRGKGFCDYPVATVAFYGPDDTRAAKVAVGSVAHEGAGANAVERWFCKTTDVRTDPEVTEAIVRFIDQHGARSVAAVDRIIGCPHEEGIDYPDGGKCPQCPFWANRDRWSGELTL
jgi:hypothetical protein